MAFKGVDVDKGFYKEVEYEIVGTYLVDNREIKMSSILSIILCLHPLNPLKEFQY